MRALLSVCVLALLPAFCNATVFTVDNNLPGGGQYATLAAAQTAASAGDTLYISGSPNSYGNFQFTKRLVLIGSGHNPQNDNKEVTTLENITFTNSLVGTTVIGVSFNNYNTSTSLDSFTLLRCRARSSVNMSSSSLSNGLLESNIFAAATNVVNASGTQWSNITFRNNVFNGTSTVFLSSASLNVLFLNNLFLTPNSSGTAFTSTQYVSFRNNIYSRVNPAAGISNAVFENNVRDTNTTATFSGGTNNTYTNNTQAAPMFVAYPAAGAGFSYSHDYSLQSTSTLINAGTDGKDIGLTGGNGLFNINGVPAIPQIRKLDITTPANGIVTPGSSITIDLRSTIKQ